MSGGAVVVAIDGRLRIQVFLRNVTPMFDFMGHQLRTIMIDGQPSFAAPDACRCIGLDPHNVARHCSGLDPDERLIVSRSDYPYLFAGKGAPTMTMLTRPGLLKLIQRSSKPQAKEFDRWVRHEVIPQVMDNGGYLAPGANVEKVVERQAENTPVARIELRCSRAIPPGHPSSTNANWSNS